MVKPFTPEEAQAVHLKNIPAFVIDTFNELLGFNYCDGEICLNLSQVLEKVCEKSGYEAQHILNMNWLDVEPLYQANGWSVSYKTPGWRDDFPIEPRFVFKKNKA